MLRSAALIAGAVLTAFHAWLFGSQAWAGRLMEMDIAVRWAAALALLVGLWMLRQGVATASTRRRSVALWVLAALLHGPALADDRDGFVSPALPVAAVTVAQAAAAITTLAATLLFLLRHTAWTLAASAGFLVSFDGRVLPARASARRLRFLPRPPPLV
jgi:hypothetical protein